MVLSTHTTYNEVAVVSFILGGERERTKSRALEYWSKCLKKKERKKKKIPKVKLKQQYKLLGLGRARLRAFFCKIQARSKY